MATKRWLGSAQDVQGVSTWTFSLTYATGDTVDVEINNKHLILTLGTDVATTDVAAETAAMINAASATAGLVGATNDETRNFGGQEIPEFTEVEASASGSVLTIKTTAGVPVVIAISVVTAGDGTVGAETVVTAATGKSFFNNADNWSGGTLPSDADTIIFDQGAVDVKYGLNNTIADLSLVRTNRYTGNIGLPAVHSLGYIEYRQRYLDLPITVTAGMQVHKIGELGSSVRASGFTRIDLGTVTGSALSLTVYDAQAMSDAGESAVQVTGGNIIVATIHRGSLDLGMDAIGTATDVSALNTTYISNQATDAVVRVGETVDWESTPEIVVNGGIVHLFSGDGSPTLTIESGTVTLDTGTTGAMGTTKIYGGTLSWISGVFVPEVFSGGTVDMRIGVDLLTSSSQPVFHEGYRYYDPKGRADWQNGIDFSGCIPGNDSSTGQVFDVIPSKNWAMTAI